MQLHQLTPPETLAALGARPIAYESISLDALIARAHAACRRLDGPTRRRIDRLGRTRKGVPHAG